MKIYWGGPREPAVWLHADEKLCFYEAEKFQARLFGLHAWQSWGTSARALWLPRCRLVHTFGLLQPIDLICLSAAGTIVAQHASVPPGRVRACRQACGTVELPAGYCRRTDWQHQVQTAWRAWQDGV